MSFTPVDAREFIPQQAPFVMVDELIYADEGNSRTTLRITDQNLFATEGFFSTAGLVEAIAQTAAAGTGYAQKIKQEPVPVGFIGAVQRLEVYDWPLVNQEIVIETKLQANLMQVSLVSGTVKMNDRLMASCELKIFISHHS